VSLVAVRFTIRQLECFVAAAELGTFSGAAERCVISEAGLSSAISELERSVGVQLLVRRRARGVTLTDAGRGILAQALEVLRRAEELQVDAGNLASVVAGPLAIGCYTTLSPFLIPPLLAGFGTEHPNVELTFHESSQPDLEQQLFDGTLELALLYDWDLRADLERIVIRAIRPHVLLAEDHPMAKQDSVSLRDLATEPMVLFDVAPSRENCLAAFERLGIKPMVGLRTENFELLRCLVSRRIGYAFLIQQVSTGLTYEGRGVVIRPIAEDVEPTSLVVAHPRTTRLTRRAELFMDYALTTLVRT
jgi:DNA-binding transcriptional LysR family regulator